MITSKRIFISTILVPILPLMGSSSQADWISVSTLLCFGIALVVNYFDQELVRRLFI
ncbi:MAG: hypothetical protein KJO60_01575 [Desulfofustis sp.]|nr:hypothetical protein [Desulfofustis sp.]MBT8353178.1 hypothetical protein [Desulfofustis sp.]NNK58327.1 hypothetical protein [Desulfofustis sp.]